MNNYSYWENKKTTSEELSIIKILLDKDLTSLGTVLHIGTGNGEALKKLYKKTIKFIGITIAGNEFNYVNSLNISNNINYLADKYDCSYMNSLIQNNSVDYIIDINLKSFAPNSKSFNLMMDNFHNYLRVGGKIITSHSGMEFSSVLTVSGNNLIQSSESIKENLLSKSELIDYSIKYKMKFSEKHITRRFFKGFKLRKKNEILYILEK
jgi:cyclopropane fatty-acyl-phospholipid synthase-like methyltransferase